MEQLSQFEKYDVASRRQKARGTLLYNVPHPHNLGGSSNFHLYFVKVQGTDEYKFRTFRGTISRSNPTNRGRVKDKDVPKVVRRYLRRAEDAQRKETVKNTLRRMLGEEFLNPEPVVDAVVKRLDEGESVRDAVAEVTKDEVLNPERFGEYIEREVKEAAA